MLLPSSSHSTVEDIFLLHTLTQGKKHSHAKQDYRHVPVATSILTRLPHSCSDPTKLMLQMALDARHIPHSLNKDGHTQCIICDRNRQTLPRVVRNVPSNEALAYTKECHKHCADAHTEDV